MIFTSFFAALGQIGDPKFRNVLFLGLGLTIGGLIAVTFAFVTLIGWFIGDAVSLPFIGEVTWVNDIAEWSSVLLMLVLSVFLMVPAASAVTSLFLDQVAQAVEDKHYPTLPPADASGLADDIKDGLSFLGLMIIANLFALILYLIFTPLAPFIFWLLNGFLLGREYFTLAAMRRIARDNAKTMRRRHIGTIWAAGTLMAIPLSVPIINLLIPILGAATFTHIFHHLHKPQS